MPFLLLPLDFDQVPLTYAIRFLGKLLPVLGTLILSSAIAASMPRRSGLLDCSGIDRESKREAHDRVRTGALFGAIPIYGYFQTLLKDIRQKPAGRSV